MPPCFVIKRLFNSQRILKKKTHEYKDWIILVSHSTCHERKKVSTCKFSLRALYEHYKIYTWNLSLRNTTAKSKKKNTSLNEKHVSNRPYNKFITPKTYVKLLISIFNWSELLIFNVGYTTASWYAVTSRKFCDAIYLSYMEVR